MQESKNAKLVIANWKVNPENLDTAKRLIKISSSHAHEGMYVTHAVGSLFAGFLLKDNPQENIILQNISMYKEGSHTGEISAAQAKNLGIKMSIVGHSETRLSPKNPHGDEDKDVNAKILNLQSEGMWACLCIGEYERKNFDYKKFLKTQIENCLKDVSDISKIIFAYEPVWAIGKDAERPATNEEIVETIGYIKSLMPQETKVLYGGSVDENNAKEILDLDVVDGLLIGRASSDPEKWEKLLANIS